MLLDLNGFKQVNDAYGHLAGDQVLKQFASELKGTFRVTDHVSRWAGDKFVVLLDGKLAERATTPSGWESGCSGTIRWAVAGDPRKVRVDAALGLTEWQPGETLAALLGRADKLMYRQKAPTPPPARPPSSDSVLRWDEPWR